MLRLIAYDIRESKRLRRMSETCLDYGVRIQYSVFVCDLSPQNWARFWARVEKLINPQEDSVIVYPLCKKCSSCQLILGQGTRYEKPLYYIF